MKKNSSIIDFFIIAPTPFYENRGCHLRIRGEAAALKKKGYRIVVATFKKGSEVKGINTTRPNFYEGTFLKGPAASWEKIPASLFLFLKALPQVIKTRPRVVYCHLLEGLFIGYFIKLFSKLLLFPFSKYHPILILDTQGSRTEEMQAYKMIKKRNGFLFKFFEYLEKTLLKLPDYIFVSSLNYKERLDVDSTRPDRIFYLPDALSLFSWEGMKKTVDYKNFEGKTMALGKISQTLNTKDYIKIKNWIERERILVIYSGSFNQAKGFPVFLRKVVPKLESNNNLRFIFGGDDARELLKQLDLNPTLAKKIVFLKKLELEDLPYFNLIGDIAVDPKPKISTESSGKILNYMAMGLPVVCFNTANNHYFLKEAGLYADKINDFIELILEISRDSRKRNETGRKNLYRAWEKFRWELQVNKIIQILNF